MLRGPLDSTEKLRLAVEVRRLQRISMSKLGTILLFDGDTLRRLVGELIAVGIVERCPDYAIRLTRRARERDVSQLLTLFDEDRASVVAVLWSLGADSCDLRRH